jgi:dipeptidyl aminopeptidase/acylaminoacyl peptidase
VAILQKCQRGYMLFGTLAGIAVSTSAPVSDPLAAQATSTAQRSMIVEDLLTVEQLGDVQVSPNGAAVALVVKRPRSATEIYQRNLLDGNDRADVWVVSPLASNPRNVTHGIQGPAGYWNPVWSPDGSMLALLSNKGDGKVRLYVWPGDATEPKRLANDGIDLDVTVVMDGAPLGPVAWIDARRILCLFRPPADGFDGGYIMKRTAMREWPKAERGHEPTASVLDTKHGMLPQQEALAIVDVGTGRIDTVAVTEPFSLSPEPNLPRTINISPNRRIAALIAQSGEVRRRAHVPVRFGDATGPLRLGIVSLERNGTLVWSAHIEPSFGDLDPQPWSAWSPDGQRFALVGTERDEYGPTSVFVVEVVKGSVRQVSPAGWRLTTLYWAGNDALVVRGHRINGGNELGSREPRQPRSDWWRLDLLRPVAPVRLTAGLPSVPSTLVPDNNGSFLGITASALWRIRASTAQVAPLTDPTEANLLSFAPETAQPPSVIDQPRQLVAIAERNGARQLLQVVVGASRAELTPISPPVPEAELVTYRPQQELSVFTSGIADTGPVVWARLGKSEGFTQLLRLNDHLRTIRRSEQRWIDYVGMDGDSLKAVLLLPAVYVPGRRYPLITYVYGGVVWDDPRDAFTDVFRIVSGQLLNLQLLTARGYAVLFPSIPLGPMGTATGGDPIAQIPRGVLPAVDRAVELGIADPERLAVMGHSYGGYSTYALITQMDRFKAAIGMAGPTDLVSWYGTFNPSRRYSEAPHQFYYAPLLLESGMGRMGTPPYLSPDRYIRNSPLFHVDRMRTPLLIIHGDLDQVAIQQAEELFTGLHRLGKPARFVRYWGEGHVIRSPANIIDMWNRIFSWLDEYLTLGGEAPDKTRAGKVGR